MAPRQWRACDLLLVCRQVSLTTLVALLRVDGTTTDQKVLRFPFQPRSPIWRIEPVTLGLFLHRSIIRQVANMVTKNDANLALSPTFR
ncbi:hypothetical protein TNCV_4656121 [Trichonephila clavipes]|nr:hypothetical protein TNCV_4656121 [Trichonephila clavipes]